MTADPEMLDHRRRQLLWRATHRGIREMDLILGGFARARIRKMSAQELDALEAIIEIPDQLLFSWATGQSPVPVAQRSVLLQDMFHFQP